MKQDANVTIDITLIVKHLVGYSIFIVNGTFPQCPAEDVLLKNPVVATTQRSDEKSESKTTSKGYRLGTKAEDDFMKAALAMSEIEIPQSSCTTRSPSFSHQPEIPTNKPRERIVPIRVEGLGGEEEEEVTDEEDEDDNMQLARALELSLQDCRNDTDKLKLRLDLTDSKTLTHLTNSVDEADEDDELRKALQLSLECVTAPPTPDPEDLRLRRLNHFVMYPNRISNNEAPANLNT